MSIASKELRDRLETLLANDLGTYTLDQDQEVPAIWHKHTPPPNNRVVKGIECVIQQTPDIGIEGMNFGRSAMDRTYTMRLINHGDSQIPESVIACIVLEFQGDVQVTPLPASTVAPEQYVFRFQAQPLYVR